MKLRNTPGMPLTPRVLITGATGFLGGYAVREFLNAGFEVLAHGRNLDALKRLALLGATPVAGDLAQLTTTQLALPGRPIHAVVHVAALSTPWGPWRDFEAANVTGTENVVQFMERNGVPRLVYVSSPSVYARRGDHLGITEDQFDPGNRLNNYIRSKIAAESLLARAHAQGRIAELIMLRPRGLIGAGDTSVAPRLLSAYQKIGVPLFGGGKNLVDLTAVENVACALRLSVQAAHAEGQVYNISNGDPRPIKDLLEILFQQLDLPPKYRAASPTVFYGLGAVLEGICKLLPKQPEPPLTRYTVTTIAYAQTLDITAAQTDLGYRPLVTVEEALAAFAAQYRTAQNTDKPGGIHG